MATGTIRKCRVPFKCWACEHEIKKGEEHQEMTVWYENGPRRTVKMHPHCFAIVRPGIQDRRTLKGTDK